MINQLTRVQVYLDPNDVSLLDMLADQIKVTRSQIIREATKAVAKRYADVARLFDAKTSKTNPLRELIGVEKSKTGRVGLDVDAIYHFDT